MTTRFQIGRVISAELAKGAATARGRKEEDDALHVLWERVQPLCPPGYAYRQFGQAINTAAKRGTWRLERAKGKRAVQRVSLPTVAQDEKATTPAEPPTRPKPAPQEWTAKHDATLADTARKLKSERPPAPDLSLTLTGNISELRSALNAVERGADGDPARKFHVQTMEGLARIDARLSGIADRVDFMEALLRDLHQVWCEEPLGDAPEVEARNGSAPPKTRKAKGTGKQHLKGVGKDLRRVYQAAIDSGCDVSPGGSGHLRVDTPEGGTVIGPSTPSDWRALRNFRAALRGVGIEGV